MKQISVAYMLGSLNRGGAETLMLDVFRNANRAPYVMIGIHRKGGAYLDAFYAAGPKMIQCAPKRLGYIRYIFRLRNIFKSEKITLVHAQHWLDGIYAYLATIGMPIRVALTLHGFFSMLGLKGFFCRLSIKMADDVYFVSRYEQDWYQHQMQIPATKCHVIYNGVDFSRIKDAKMAHEIPLKKGLQLVMVGNFMSGRDHLTLIKALQLLNERGVTNFDFYFIGKRSDSEPYLYDECKRICKENKMSHVHFMGGRSDVPALLKAMDGFVYSTDHDTFGIAVVEAMYAGLPIVVNDWPVMKEVCGDSINKAVTYFKSKDVEDCASAIEKLLKCISESTAEFKKRSANNAQWVRERYSIEAYIERLHHIYCE